MFNAFKKDLSSIDFLHSTNIFLSNSFDYIEQAFNESLITGPVLKSFLTY